MRIKLLGTAARAPELGEFAMVSITLRCAVAAAAIVATSSAFAAVNLISDGDFSVPNTNGSFVNGGTSFQGWTTFAANGIEIGATALYGLPCISTGCQNLELDGNTWGIDSYTVTGLTAGQRYTLSYDYGVRNTGGPSSATTTFGGVLLTTDGVGSGTGWHFDSFTVIAASATEDLVLTAAHTGTPSFGNEYTNFSLTAAPEPSTWAMMLAGFAFLGYAGYRGRRSAAALGAQA